MLVAVSVIVNVDGDEDVAGTGGCEELGEDGGLLLKRRVIVELLGRMPIVGEVWARIVGEIVVAASARVRRIGFML